MDPDPERCGKSDPDREKKILMEIFSHKVIEFAFDDKCASKMYGTFLLNLVNTVPPQ